MLGNRLRHRPNIKKTLRQYIAHIVTDNIYFVIAISFIIVIFVSQSTFREIVCLGTRYVRVF